MEELQGLRIRKDFYSCLYPILVVLDFMEYKERVISDPDIMLGKAIIKGTRITVELVLRKISEGMTPDDLLEAYPHLSKEDILAAVSYSADVIEREELLLVL